MTGLTEDYLREVEATLRVEPARKQQILDELRGHLQEKVNDLKTAAPDRTYADIEHEVIHDLGSARDLALAYTAEGDAVLQNRAGDTVLRLTSAMGRGATTAARVVRESGGKALKVIAIGLGVCLLLAVALGAWVYVEYGPMILTAASEAEPVFEHSESCAMACENVYSQRFLVKPEATQVRFEVEIWGHRGDSSTRVAAGTVHITIIDANGTVRYDRALNATSGAMLDSRATWAATPGEWTADVRVEGFVGHLHARTWASSTPLAESAAWR